MGSGDSKGISDEEVGELKNATKFSSKEIKEWYDKFHEDYPDGFITKDDFLTMYKEMFAGGDVIRFAEHVFRAYDTDGSGTIDFNEFLVTLSVASKGSVNEKLEWAYRMYDIDGNGEVSRTEAVEIITAIYKMRGEGATSKEKAEEAAEQIFLYLDKDKDDQLSQKEFVQAAKSSPAIMKLLKN